MILALYKYFLKQRLRYVGNIIMGLFNVILRAIILVFFAQAFTSAAMAKGYGLTAMILLSFVSQALRDVGFFFREQEYYGTFYRIFATPANRVLLILTYSLASSTIMVLEILVIISAGRILGVHIVPGFRFRFTAFSVRLTAFGFSLLISPIGIFAKNVAGPIINLTQTIIYLLTGVFFPVSLLPHSLQVISNALPFTKVFEAFRGATIYGRGAEMILEYSMYGIFRGIAMTAVATLIIRISERIAMNYGYERL